MRYLKYHIAGNKIENNHVEDLHRNSYSLILSRIIKKIRLLTNTKYIANSANSAPT